MQRVRVEPEDDDNFRLLVTTDKGLRTFLWSKCNHFMVGEDDESKQVVINMQLNPGGS